MIDLAGTLRRVVSVLESERIPHMVIGGVANLVWGDARTTVDLDLTVEVAEAGLERFLDVAGRCGSHIPDDPLDVARRGRLVAVRAPEGIRIDFSLATLPFESDAIRRARVVRVLEDEVRVCSPDDLIIMKSVSARPRDHDDVIGILRRQAGKLDIGALDRTIEALAGDLAEPAVADRWRAAKDAARPASG